MISQLKKKRKKLKKKLERVQSTKTDEKNKKIAARELE